MKKTYDAEYKAWYESLDKETIKAYEKATGKKVAAPGGKAGSKKARDELARQSGQPARPLTAFFEYLEHLRQGDGKGLGVVELAKKAGEEWKGMVEEEKKVRLYSHVAASVSAGLGSRNVSWRGKSQGTLGYGGGYWWR